MPCTIHPYPEGRQPPYTVRQDASGVLTLIIYADAARRRVVAAYGHDERLVLAAGGAAVGSDEWSGARKMASCAIQNICAIIEAWQPDQRKHRVMGPRDPTTF